MPRIVIKLGTSTVTGRGGEPSPALATYARTCAQLREQGWAPIIVTSGAVGAGRMPLGLVGKKLSLVEKQAAAAIGQSRLMETYRQHFEAENLTIAQILLSRGDIADRGRCNNARQAMEFYKSVFGGTLTMNTFGEFGDQSAPEANKIMHAMLETDSQLVLMASDLPPGMEHTVGNNISVSLSGNDAEELRGYWKKLTDGGTITMPMEKQMWGDEFGMCVDKFGITWMVDISQ